MKKRCNIINNSIFAFGIGIKIKVICLIFLLCGFGIAEETLSEKEKIGAVEYQQILVQENSQQQQNKQIQMSSQLLPSQQQQQQQQQPLTTILSFYLLQKQLSNTSSSGLKDNKLYINNGSYQTIILISQWNFSAVVEYEDQMVTITAIGVSKRLQNNYNHKKQNGGQLDVKEETLQLQKEEEKQNVRKYFIRTNPIVQSTINEQKQNINNNNLQKQKNSKSSPSQAHKSFYNKKEKYIISQTQPQAIIHNQNQNQHKPFYYYQISLDIYIISKTLIISTNTLNLPIQISLLFKNQNLAPKQQKQTLQQQQKLLLFIPTVIYCISQLTVHEANYFLEKVYYIILIIIFGLILRFRPFQYLNFWVRAGVLGMYMYLAIVRSRQQWYTSLILTYGVIIALIFITRASEQRHSHHSPYRISLQTHPNLNSSYIQKRKQLLTKSFSIISLATGIPLALHSNIRQTNQQIHLYTIYIINFIMLINNIIFVSSIIKINRFRNSFYYLLGYFICEYEFAKIFTKSLVFKIVSPQIFNQPYRCESYVFMIFIIPLCDFYFQQYSRERFLKFLVMIIPLMLRPMMQVSYTVSFLMVWGVWIVNQAVKGRDFVKIIKFKN